jgi:hypothetical protein
MNATLKYPVFIDALCLQLVAKSSLLLKAVLRDDKGSICSTLETTLPNDNQRHELNWKGLNHLPYGIYTLELSQGEDAMQLRLVKRV